MSQEAFNQRTVKCVNPRCPHFDQPRVVSLPLLAGGLCLGGGIYCECGYQGECMRVVEEE